MDETTAALLAQMQAQIDELQERLVETLAELDVLTVSCWELGTALEWLVEEHGRSGHMRSRVQDRLSIAIEAIEELIGERHAD